MPTQVVNQCCALPHQPLAVIDELTDLQRLVIEYDDREAIDALLDRSASDSQRVDRIGFAGLSGTLACASGQFRGDANDPFAVTEQEPFQPAADMPAVLDRPDPLAAQAASPIQQLTMPLVSSGRRADRLLTARHLLHRGTRVGRFMSVHPDHDHRCHLPRSHRHRGLLAGKPQ